MAQLILSFFGIIDPFLDQFLGRYARPHALAYEPSFYALYMSIFVMFFNTRLLLNKDSLFYPKKLLQLFFVNLLLIISTSTGSFFAYFIFIGVLFIFSFVKKMKKEMQFLRKNIVQMIIFFSFIFLVFAACFPNIFFTTFFKFFTGLALSHWSFMARWAGIVNCWKVFLEYPFFGVGLGGVGAYLFKILSPTADLPKDLSDLELYDPTNVLTEVLASLGLYGFIAFIVLGIVVFNCFKKTIALTTISQEDKKLAIALFMSLIISTIVLQFNQGLFRTYLWVHTAVNIGFFLKMLHLDSLKR